MTYQKLTPRREAVLKTLAYSGVFKYPLSAAQIYTNLISQSHFSSKQIRKELKELVKEKIVAEKDNKYALNQVELVDIKERIRETELTVKRNKKIFEALENIPWIKMIAITGSTANYNNERDSDIDLLFVTAKNRVWLTRGFVFLFLKLMNKLPKNHKAREICPNIFIDEKNLSWVKKKRNLYVAQNIISMQPIFVKDDMYFRFIHANSWIKSYYKNFKFLTSGKFSKPSSSESLFMNLIENLAMKMQLSYMKNKITTEVASKNLIHFNKNDNSKVILSKYKALLKSLRV